MSEHSPRCIFLSDVHLSPADPSKTARFLEFLRRSAGRAERLYILGDLFDFWIGPKHLALPDHRPVLAALRDLPAAGVRVFFLPGNRDYQAGSEFARAAGVEMLPAQAEVVLGGRRVYLAHGDFLYNRNPKYAAYRRLAGTRGVRRLVAGLPAPLAVRLAAGFRGATKRGPQAAPYRSAEELLAPAAPLFARGFDVVLCGHLHQPVHLAAAAGGRTCELLILGEWKEGCPHARCEGGRFRLVEG